MPPLHLDLAPCDANATTKGSLCVRLFHLKVATVENQQIIQKKIEQRITNYRKRYFRPTKVTIRRWQEDVIRELDQNNQLSLPLVFMNEDRNGNHEQVD